MTASRSTILHAGLAACVVVAVVWIIGFLSFAITLPVPSTDTARTDAIVVLTGGSARLATGFDLLHQNRADKLFVSGVSPGIDPMDLAALAEAGPDQVVCCVVVGYQAANTVGNAAETAAWMRDEGYQSLRLVTADYHIRRSMVEFQRAMPAISIILHPVAPTTVNSRRWWRDPDAAWLVLSEFNKYLIAMARGLLPASPPT